MHYALGSWRECIDGNCADADGTMIQSSGAAGFHPWLWRNGKDSHWGIVSQNSLPTGIMKVNALMKEAFPLARKAIENSGKNRDSDSDTDSDSNGAVDFVSECGRVAVRSYLAM